MSDEDGVRRIIKQQALSLLTFFPHLNVFLTSNIFPPGLLDGPRIAVKLSFPRLFKQKELRGGKTKNNQS